MFRDFDAIV